MDEIDSTTMGRPTTAVIHSLLAAAYLITMVISVSTVYAGTFVSIAWPPVGIAVWWALTCRSRRGFILVCAFVFVALVLYLSIAGRLPTAAVLLIGIAHVIAGPAIALVVKWFERWDPTTRSRRHHRFVLTARIMTPGDVYRLLVASLLLIPAAKVLSILAISVGGDSVSITLYASLILRDLAGVIAVAGPGIAISSGTWKGVRASTVVEFVVAMVGTGVLLAVIFGPGRHLPIVYLTLLPLYWSATRLPVAVASLHAVVTAGAATVLAYAAGYGPFAVSDETLIVQATAVQLFIIMCVLLSLVVSTTVQEHSALVAEFETVTETIPDGLLIVDRSGRASPLNASAREFVIESEDGEAVPRDLTQVEGLPLDGSDRPDRRVLQDETVRGMLVEFADDRADDAAAVRDERRVYTLSASPLRLPDDDEPWHAVLLYHDSTDEYRAQRRLRRAYDQVVGLFEHAPQGVATLDAEGRILQANHALGALVGVPVDRLAGRRIGEFSSEADLAEDVAAALENPGTVIRSDRCLTGEDGRRRLVDLSFRTLAGEDMSPVPLLFIAIDVTERQRVHDAVSHLADHDSLTGLVNRRRFEAELERMRELHELESEDGALLLMDLDNFKTVNDELGHHAGDALLVEFAALLTDCVRSTDTVGRWGGDEFVVALPGAGLEAAVAIASRIVQTVREGFSERQNALGNVTTSVGIALLSEARDLSVSPMELADQLLYRAKRSGRNRFATLALEHSESSSSTGESARGRVERILETGALRLELQPIVDVATGHVVLAEGLVRVASSEEPIAAAELVGTVERAGLGSVLDAHVLRMGIGLLPELRRVRPGFRLSLNLSAQSMVDDEIARLVISELEKHGLPAQALVLELTETAPVADLDAARRFQRLLRDHGVVLALDDFGVGHDPYRILGELDFDIVKIAGEFVRSMPAGGMTMSIVASIVRLAKEQGMATVAEYVSDEQILHSVRQSGVTFAQGHFFGASLPPEEFIATHLSAECGATAVTRGVEP